MNILSGISMAAAGIGALRKAFGANGGDGSGRRITVKDQPPLTTHHTRPMERTRGPAGRALAEMFGFRRGDLRWKQDPALFDVNQQSDLIKLYKKYGYPLEEGDVNPATLSRQEFEKTAERRAKRDWQRMIVGERVFKKGRKGEKGPEYVAPTPDTRIYVHDSISRVPSKGQVDISRVNDVYLQDEDGHVELVSRASIPSAQRDLDAILAERNRVFRQLRETNWRIRTRTGKNVYELSQEELSVPGVAAEMATLVSLRERSRQLSAMGAKNEARLMAFAEAQVLARTEQNVRALQARLGTPGIKLSVPGVIKLERKGLEGRAESWAELIRAAEEAEREYDTRYEVPESSSEGMSPEARRAEREIRGQGIQRMEQLRREQGEETGPDIRELTEFREFRDYVPGQDEGRGSRRGGKRSKGKKGIARLRSQAPGSGEDDLDGMDAASGMMAPDVALVDGLGAGPGTAALGIGSLILIGAGAFVIYRVFQSASAKPAAA